MPNHITAKARVIVNELEKLNESDQKRLLQELSMDTPALAAEVRRLLASNGEQVSAPSDQDPGELIGQRIGTITIQRPLRAGGMADIFIGFDEKLKREVAVKTIRGMMKLDQQFRARFLREAEVLSRLEHPLICRIYDFVESDHCDFLIMELVDGQNLVELEAYKLDTGTKLQLAAQIAEALSISHAKGIIHRDLKPENIMLTKRGDVKVLDFGLARESHEPHRNDPSQTDTSSLGDQHLSRIGRITGTYRYMSPEQANGLPVTPASDVYSLGLIMQWLFTGQQAYPDDLQKTELLIRAQKGQPAKIEGARSDIAELIEQLEFFDSIDRPSADEALHKLNFLIEKPRRRAKRWALSAIVFLLLAGTIISSIGFISARHETARVQETLSILQGFIGSINPEQKGNKDYKVHQLLADNIHLVGKIEDPQIRASLQYTFAQSYLGLGMNQKAYELARESYDVRNRVFGLNNTETLASRKQIVQCLLELGEYEESTIWANSLLPELEAEYGTRHTETLHLLKLLGTIYWQQGMYTETEAIDRRIYEIHLAERGPLAEETLATKANLVIDLVDLGHYAEAIDMGYEVLDAQTRVLGPDDPTTLRTMNNLTVPLMHNGRREEGIALLHKVLSARTRTLGESHPQTISTLNNIGYSEHLQGHYTEAEVVFEQALKAANEDMDKVFLMASMAQNKSRIGHWDAAVSLFSAAIEQSGKQHTRYPLCLTGLGEAYTRQENFPEAHAVLSEALEMMEQENKPRILPWLLNSIAALDIAENRIDSALENSIRSINVLGEDSKELELGSAYLLQARSYLAANNEAFAASLENAIEFYEKEKLLDHPDYAAALYLQAVQLKNLQQPYRHLLEKALEIQQKQLLDNHPDLLQTKAMLRIHGSDSNATNMVQ